MVVYEATLLNVTLMGQRHPERRNTDTPYAFVSDASPLKLVYDVTEPEVDGSVRLFAEDIAISRIKAILNAEAVKRLVRPVTGGAFRAENPQSDRDVVRTFGIPL